MLEADLEAVDVVAELRVVVEEQQPGQVVHCTAAHVLRDEPGEEGRLDEVSVSNPQDVWRKSSFFCRY